MALIPIAVWELSIKPMRNRRNIAIVLLAETEANLDEIAYYRLSRERDSSSYLVNLALPDVTYSAIHASLADLPVNCVEDLMRFYNILRKIDATNLALEATRARLFVTTDPGDKKMLEASMDQGLRSLGFQLDHAWQRGTSARASLNTALRESWPDTPTTIASPELIIARAKERYAQYQLLANGQPPAP